MDISISEKSGVKIILVNGRLIAGNADGLKNSFSEVAGSGGKFVFDLSGLEYVDSTGLGALVFCLHHLSVVGGDMKLANLQSKPKVIFDLTRAYKMFDIYEDVDAAVESFGV